MASLVVRFLVGEGRDQDGRSLAEIIAFDDAGLERRGDCLPWMFPLASDDAGCRAPRLRHDDIAQLRSSEAARLNLSAAASRMTRFYATNDEWLAPRHDDHLQIARIIGSLRLLLGAQAAETFRAEILDRVGATRAEVNPMILECWSKA